MNYIWLFVCGALLCNALPHLAAGLRGEPFPTPFARPPGRRPSAPLVNFLWGALNVGLGMVLLAQNPVTFGADAGFYAIIAGALAAGMWLSSWFDQVRNG